MKDKRVHFRVPDSLKQDMVDAAYEKRMTLTQYLLKLAIKDMGAEHKYRLDGNHVIMEKEGVA